MDLSEFFKKDYIEISENNQNLIYCFIDESQEEKMRYKKPLQTVFIHKNFNEMYLILDCTKYTFEDIEEICEQWESNVLEYINFGKEYKENKAYLKYNISLIILRKDTSEEKETNYRYEIEKSKIICKKIFILTDEFGKILESNKIMFPFYFEPLENIVDEVEEEFGKKLSEILPKDMLLRSKLESNEKFTQEDENAILRWIESDE